MQTSLESPDMVASIKNQLKNGGKDFIIVKIINSVRIALKLLVLIFLLIKSRFLMPECSTRINKSPIKPINNGKKQTEKANKELQEVLYKGATKVRNV